MTGNNGRILLAPHLGPWPPIGAGEAEGPGPRFYLSWPGWEDFLKKRLDLASSGPYRPLMLPDAEGLTQAALEQLAERAGNQGAGLWPLLVHSSESPGTLAQAIRLGLPAASRPILSDRAYLALWTLSEGQADSSARLLAEAARKERAMWAALKGEEAAPPQPAAPMANAPDRRTAYAWQSWRRLAAPLLRPDDLILPTAPEEAGL